MVALLRPRDLHGLMVVWKPRGASSMDALRVIKSILNDNSVKVGHGGTLDPLAQGVLVVGINRGCGLLTRYLTGTQKTYACRAQLGISTDTYDLEGTVTQTRPVRDDLSADAIERHLDAFRGDFDQRPPRFSAKHVGGVRSYVLARSGQPMPTPKPVRVSVRALSLAHFEPPEIALELTCSSGFYVRSLVHDLGEAIGCGAVMTFLERTAQGGFTAGDAVALGDLTLPVIAAHLRMPPHLPVIPSIGDAADVEQAARNAAAADTLRARSDRPHGALRRRDGRAEWTPRPRREAAAERERRESEPLWKALIAERSAGKT